MIKQVFTSKTLFFHLVNIFNCNDKVNTYHTNKRVILKVMSTIILCCLTRSDGGISIEIELSCQQPIFLVLFSSTETDINIWLAKAWTAIKRLSVILKSYLTDKMKRSFFQAAVVSILLYRMHYMNTNEMDGEKAWRQLHKNAVGNIE